MKALRKKRLIKEFAFGDYFSRELVFLESKVGLESTVIESIAIDNLRRADGKRIKGQLALQEAKREICINPHRKHSRKPGLDDIRFGIGKWKGGKNTDLFMFISGYTRGNISPDIRDGTEVITVNPDLLWPPRPNGMFRGFSLKKYMQRNRKLAEKGHPGTIARFEKQEEQGYNVVLPYVPERPVKKKIRAALPKAKP